MELGATLTQHVLSQQRLHPQARGEFSGLLTQIGVAAKIISSQVRRAGLLPILGASGTVNTHGEVVQKLDEVANRTVIECLIRSGHVAAMASEEEDEYVEVPEARRGAYIVVFDPLDGSSNIDVNISIGTIFAVYRQASGGEVTRRDFLRPGREACAAGYVIYGSSTMFVYSTGQGVHGFTLDPSAGEFFLSHADIRIPNQASCLSLNESNSPYWEPWVGRFVGEMKARNDEDKRRVSSRHVGSLVADFHRNLMYGGVFLYPGDRRSPRGKLRLLYEAAPLAFIAAQAGGAASDGAQDILDIVPDELHQRTPLVVGNAAEVRLAEEFARGRGEDGMLSAASAVERGSA